MPLDEADKADEQEATLNLGATEDINVDAAVVAV